VPRRGPGPQRRDAQPADMDAFAAHLAGNYVPNTVIVDATASSRLPERYMAWMQARPRTGRGALIVGASAGAHHAGGRVSSS